MQTATQSTRGFNLIFLHSSLDDAGLSVAEFRVLAHLSRRAGTGKAWPGVENIAEVCKINHKTAREAIKTLTERKMILCGRRPGKTTVYEVTSHDEWIIEVLPKQAHPNEAGVESTQKEPSSMPEMSGPVLPKQADEGYKVKEIQEGKDIVAGATAPDDVTDAADAEAERKQRHTLFMRLWCEGYVETFGDPYVVLPQDGKALKQFLTATSSAPIDLVGIGREAWAAKKDRRKFFKCGHATTIHGFIKWFNDIKAELLQHHKINHPSSPVSQWDDIGQRKAKPEFMQDGGAQ